MNDLRACRLAAPIALLLALTACGLGSKKSPPPSDLSKTVTQLSAEPIIVPAFDTTPTRKGKAVTPAWPLVDRVYGYEAPPGDIFLTAAPLSNNRTDRGLIALTIPREAAGDTLQKTLLGLHNKRITALYLPPPTTDAKGEDAELELLDERENLALIPFHPALAASFSIRVEDQRLVSVCFPTGLADGYQVAAEPRITQHCRSWLVDDAHQFHDLDDEAGEVHVRHFQADTTDAPLVGERFFVGEDARLRRRVTVALPALHNETPSTTVVLELTTDPDSPPALAPWPLTSAAADIRAWVELPGDHPVTLNEAFDVAARLVALRGFSASLDRRASAYLTLEADALQRIAMLLLDTYDSWSAWSWLAQLNKQLDGEATGVLPRPSATLLLVSEAEEIPPLRWRGSGYTMPRHAPPHWMKVGDNWMLYLPTTRGVRVCSQTRCERYDPTAIEGQPTPTFPSLQHPYRPIQALSLWRNERGDEVIFTGTDRAHSCDLDELCNADGRCTVVTKATIERKSRFDGPMIHRQRIPNTPPATTPSCDVEGQIDSPGRLALWRANGLVVSGHDSLRQFSPESDAYGPLDPEQLTQHERMIAGIDDSGARYFLRSLAGELSVWRVEGKTPELVRLTGLQPVDKPLGDSGWAIPSPDGRFLVVAHGGTVLGVWPLKSPDDTP